MSVLLFLLLAFFSREFICVQSQENGFRIIGGTPAGEGRFQWMVSLQNKNNQHICGGVLIRDDLVLTAAHCLFHPETDVAISPSELSVLIGTQDLSVLSNAIEVQVQEIRVHKHYRPKNRNLDFDIAILKLQRSSYGAKKLTPINLPNGHLSESVFTASGSVLRVIGWGNTRDGHTSKLLTAIVPYVSNEECQKKYSPDVLIVTSHVICTSSHVADICQGDSGGPLILESKDSVGNTVETLVGVTSMSSPNCGRPNSASLFTRISKFRYNFIQPELERATA